MPETTTPTRPAHTPGPVLPGITSGRWYARHWARHASTTVVVDDPTVFTGVRVVAECETEADARLIACAPELLDIAQSIELALLFVSAAVALDENSPIRDALRAAISRATGSAS